MTWATIERIVEKMFEADIDFNGFALAVPETEFIALAHDIFSFRRREYGAPPTDEMVYHSSVGDITILKRKS